MKGENVVGALMAASNVFFTVLAAMMIEKGIENLASVSDLTWILVIGGTVGAFWKDYQALAVRRWSAEKVLGTETHYPKSAFPKAYGLPEPEGGDPSTTEKRVDDES